MTRGPRLQALRPRLSRIGLRLLAFNLVAVFLPVAGILYLDVYEQQLLQAQERSMIQQARLLAAALGGREAVPAAEAGMLLGRVDDRGDARLRIYDGGGRLVADSARLQPAGPASGGRDAYRTGAADGVRTRPLYRIGAWLARTADAIREAVRAMSARDTPRGTPGAVPVDGPPPEVRRALAGRYGAATRPTPGQRSLTLNSAVPIRSGEGITGAVLVSQSTFRILQAVYVVRLRVFEIVVAAMGVAALLSVLLSTTIVRPLVRLRRAAAVLSDPSAGAGLTLPGSDRRDEIGDLARALEDVTRRLDAHVRLLEAFAADVAHEFRNPLASIRTAGEMMADAPEERDRQRFLAMLTRDVDRLERLVSGVRELARIDAQLAHEPLVPVDLGALVASVVEGFRLSSRSAVPIELEAAAPAGGAPVRASPERLVHVFENVLVNACSFAPPGTTVVVRLAREGDSAVVTVLDRGPGIPAEHLERIFERFFTYRPDESPGRRDHAGLGLAIARAIVEGHGGDITAANRRGGGASIRVRLPVADAAALPVPAGAAPVARGPVPEGRHG